MTTKVDIAADPFEYHAHEMKRKDNIAIPIQVDVRESKDPMEDVFTMGIECPPTFKVLLSVIDGKLDIIASSMVDYTAWRKTFTLAEVGTLSGDLFDNLALLRKRVIENKFKLQFTPPALTIEVEILERKATFPLEPQALTAEQRIILVMEDFRQYRTKTQKIIQDLNRKVQGLEHTKRQKEELDLILSD